MLNKKMSLVLAIVLVGSLLLAACTPAETEIETVIVTQIVVETVEVEVGGEIQTVEVTKEVQVEVTREVIVEVEAGEPAEDRVTLNVILSSEPPTMDPSLGTDNISIRCIDNTFIALTQIDPHTIEVGPYLATSWDVSADGTVYTFHLRDDVQWVKYNRATGETEAQRPVTAYDVEYGIKRTIDPSTASDYAYVLYLIKNAMAVNTSEEGVTLDDVGVVALDDTTLEITLDYPAGYFLSIASMWVAKPMPQEAIDEAGDRWIEPDFIWTNGPYVVTEWIHGGSMRFEKNPIWIHADDVQIEVVEAVVIQEASTEFAMYENNELDTAGVPQPEIPRVKEDPILSQDYFQAPDASTYFYGFTHTKAPFDDVLVRTAFSAAIDRQTLIDTVTLGGQIPATSFAPPGIFGAPPPGTVGIGFDPDLATASLAEYGGVDDFDIVLGHNTSEGHARIAAAIQAMWDQVLGVNVRVENQEWSVYLDTIKKTSPVEEMFHVWRLGWGADYADENNWVHEVFNFEAGANRLRRQCEDTDCTEFIGPAEFDDLTVAAGKEQDPAKRLVMYEDAERLLAETNADAAFIYHYTVVNVTKPWLERNFPVTGGDQDWYRWTIDWEAKKAATGQ